jgi:hypothetical protein
MFFTPIAQYLAFLTCQLPMCHTCMHLFYLDLAYCLCLNLFICILKVNCQYIINTRHQWTSYVLVIYLSTHTWIEFDGLFYKTHEYVKT